MTLTTEEFIYKAKQIHGNKYDYSLVDYKRTDEKIIIICPVHGKFEQKPNAHLKGNNCRECSNYENGLRQRQTKEQFIEKAKKVHGDKIDFSKFEYITNKHHGICICTECKIEWLSRPDILLANKSHCPNCKINSIYTKAYYLKHNIENHPCYIYLCVFKKEDEKFLKIGISKNIKYRFREMCEYDILVSNSYHTDFFNAYDLEQSLLKEYAEYKYKPKYKFKGHTECLQFSVYDEIRKRFELLSLQDESLVE